MCFLYHFKSLTFFFLLTLSCWYLISCSIIFLTISISFTWFFFLSYFHIAILLLGLSLKSLLTQLNSRTPTLTPNPYYPRTLTLHFTLSLTNIALQTVNSEFSVPSIFSDFLFKFSSNRFNYYLLFFLIFYRTTIFKQNFNQWKNWKNW